MHDFARVLADQIPGAAPRDVSVHFTVRRQAAAQHGYRSRGGPVTVYAQALHAQLYGLPTDEEPLPVALDALLQAAHTADGPEQQGAVLQQLAEQLRNAAEILEWARNHAHWRQLPVPTWEWLRDATETVRATSPTASTPSGPASPPNRLHARRRPSQSRIPPHRALPQLRPSRRPAIAADLRQRLH
ncbi:hypothetical protein ACIRPN_17840 [Streptomyces sp. NPDC101230]|uniref:hypothetical protein n=1 Tax=unclassified Streptomyces TaxID=2593676 RepID=UPI00382C587D